VPQAFAVQVETSHSEPDGGQSEAERHGTHAPLPSQTVPPLLQGVPAATCSWWHAPARHAATVHTGPAGHCAATLHWTQVPLPSHTTPPFSVHGASSWSGLYDGTPATHVALVHSPPSVGTSLSSAMELTPPDPSHTALWQSPVVCVEAGTPDTLKVVPQTPATQAGSSHSEAGRGQSALVAHGPRHVPAAHA
jgi:hypothetical protein